MGIDYYSVLELARSATDEEVRKAYARVSVRERPERIHACDGTPLTAEQLSKRRAWFQLAGEAYEVLSSPLLRATYDQFGEDGLKNGVPARDPDLFLQPYVYHGDPIKTFRNFFGSESMSVSVLLAWQRDARKPDGAQGPWFREPPLQLPLPVSLELAARGGPASVTMQRREIHEGELVTRDHVFHVDLPPGVTSGTVFFFPQQGHQALNSIPADVSVVVENEPHDVFTRESSADVVATFVVSLEEALLGCVLDVPALDGRTLRVRVTDVVTPGYELRVHGEGLPRCRVATPAPVQEPRRECYAISADCCHDNAPGTCRACAFSARAAPQRHASAQHAERQHDAALLPDGKSEEGAGQRNNSEDENAEDDDVFIVEEIQDQQQKETQKDEPRASEDDEPERGDLVLRFVVQFPAWVAAPRRRALRLALRGLTPSISQDRAHVSPQPASREP